jgi:hypothetical protein
MTEQTWRFTTADRTTAAYVKYDQNDIAQVSRQALEALLVKAGGVLVEEPEAADDDG